MDPKARILHLTKELNRHNELYYQQAEPEISDQAFDKLMEELTRLEQEHPEFAQPDSPTQRVGGTITKAFASVPHRVPMLSLANTYSEEELRDFVGRVVKVTGEGVEFTTELKWDGVAISLHYEKGTLVRGITRGDGVRGDDITTNVKTIRSIPLKVTGDDVPDYFEVRGEVFMPLEAFARLNHETELQNEELRAAGKKEKNLFKNPRNATAGTLKLQDSGIVSRRKLGCYVYYLSEEGTGTRRHSESLEKLARWGFKVSPHWQQCLSVEDVMAYIHGWESRRPELELNTDGVVVKVDRYKLQQDLGATAKAPRWAIAYKYKAEIGTTTLNRVMYWVGRTGAVTPVAEFDGVELGGTTVKNASLYNADEIVRLNLHLGDVIQVEKAGEIIPKVVAVLADARKPDAEPVVFPTHCTTCIQEEVNGEVVERNIGCGTELVRNEGDVVTYCPNASGCRQQVIGRLLHFASRDALYIDGLGEKVMEKLVDKGVVMSHADLYSLTVEQLLELKIGFQERGASNLVAAIEKSKERPFEAVLFGLGIRHVGETIAEKLAQQFGSIDGIMAASAEDLLNATEIGPVISVVVPQWFAHPENRILVDRLKAAGLKLEYEFREKVQEGDALAGQTFLVSGVFEKFSREEIQDKIERNGGKLASGVSAKLGYLVVGDKAGASKLDKAKKLGVKMISEDELIGMLGS